jgi:hypothetical protein
MTALYRPTTRPVPRKSAGLRTPLPWRQLSWHPVDPDDIAICRIGETESTRPQRRFRREAAMTHLGSVGTPSNIDVGEIHDCITGVELINHERPGFVSRFEAHKLIEASEICVAGSILANPGRGLKANCVRIGLAHNVGRPTCSCRSLHPLRR